MSDTNNIWRVELPSEAIEVSFSLPKAQAGTPRIATISVKAGDNFLIANAPFRQLPDEIARLFNRIADGEGALFASDATPDEIAVATSDQDVAEVADENEGEDYANEQW